MDHQDWKQVTLVKNPNARRSGESKSTMIAKAARAGNVSVEKKFAAGGNKSAHSSVLPNARKLEEETEEFKGGWRKMWTGKW